MKILLGHQTREADILTLPRQGISRSELMERAATAAWNMIQVMLLGQDDIVIFCGPGNNGGDGLVLARFMQEIGKEPKVFILGAKVYSPEFREQEGKLFNLGVEMKYVRELAQVPEVSDGALVIDAMFGTGLNRPLDAIARAVVDAINMSDCTVLAIDIPTGLPAEGEIKDISAVVVADHTFTFHAPKLSFLLPDTGMFVGQFSVIDIGLDPEYIASVETPYYYTTPEVVLQLKDIVRPKFASKAMFGSLLLVGGSGGNTGCLLLAAQAAMRSGLGELSLQVPSAAMLPLNIQVPEANVIPDLDDLMVTTPPDFIEIYSAVAVGIGVGDVEQEVEKKVLADIISEGPNCLLLEGTALLMATTDKKLMAGLGENTVLVATREELSQILRLKPDSSHFAQLQKARELAQKHAFVVVIKGAHTITCLPDGEVYINSTGNAGMATTASGDVFFGLLAGLCAAPLDDIGDSAIFAAFLHGLAGDLAAKKLGMEAVTAGAIVRHLGAAYKKLRTIDMYDMPF